MRPQCVVIVAHHGQAFAIDLGRARQKGIELRVNDRNELYIAVHSAIRDARQLFHHTLEIGLELMANARQGHFFRIAEPIHPSPGGPGEIANGCGEHQQA